MEFKEELIVTQRISSNNEDKNTWTITSRFGEILRYAEKLFGERDLTYTLLGVEFAFTDKPCIWHHIDSKQIVVQLTITAANNVNLALFQLSHETIHCLSPTGQRDANILEEGLASYFSYWYLKEKGLEYWIPAPPEYEIALGLVNQLLAIDEEIIKKVRLLKPIISEISTDDFLKVNPSIDRALLDNLCKPFYN